MSIFLSENPNCTESEKAEAFFELIVEMKKEIVENPSCTFLVPTDATTEQGGMVWFEFFCAFQVEFFVNVELKEKCKKVR